MPTYTFKCKNCKYEHEEKIDIKHAESKYGSVEEWTEWWECNNYCCEPGDLKRLMTAPALIGMDKAHIYGVNGVFNRGLGEYVYSDADLRKKAKAKGLVLAADAGITSSGWSQKVDQQFDQDIKQAENHEKAIAKIKDGLDTHKDEGRAIAEAYSVEQMKETGALAKDFDKAS
jgi:predicted nucleic acid-binding Zn ribbon protein